MFHSSSSRHEQYLVRPSHSRATLNKKRSSLESEISGADSGYTSSSSTPSSTSGSPTTISAINQVTLKSNEPNDEFKTSKDNDSNINDTPVIVAKKKKSKRHQPPRQPDLVYSCPRPLAFPFHNDDHFLPIAEADPRDVARVSPSLNRSPSLQSSKTSVGSSRMYDSGSYHYVASNSNRTLDAESSYSRQSSILSTIQRGTVRSIRSLFQLADSPSNKEGLIRVQTNNTSHTNYSSTTRRTADSTTSTIQPSLKRLEIKKGTVQSIKDMFSMKRSSLRVVQPTQPPPPSRQQKGFVGATIGQFESSNLNNYSRANINASAATLSKNKKQSSTTTTSITFKPVAVNVTKPKTSFASRASEFASRALWKSSKPTVVNHNSVSAPAPAPAPAPPSSATKLLPKNPAPTKTLKSEVKKFSVRMFALPKTWRNDDEDPVSNAASPNKQKRSIFSSFKRADISASISHNNSKKSSTAATDVPPPTTTTVGKMWKSFKNLVAGKKSSRVGVL